MKMERATHLSASALDPPETEVLARLLADRRSCRGFLPKPVPRAVIERILTLAQFTASWCNSQPWQIIITEGDATERFRAALMADVAANPEARPDFPFPERWAGVYQDRKRDVGWQLYSQMGINRGDREASRKASLENFNLFNAPHAAILTTERDIGVYGAIDCGFYAANFLLAAQSFGVGTIAQAALAQRAWFLRTYFKIPENRLVLFGIAFGYADRNHPANNFSSRRAGLEEVVQWMTE